MVAGDEEDGEQRQLQGLQVVGTASPTRGGGSGRVALASEGLELPRRPEGIAGELELGDGGPRPARPGYGCLRARGVGGSGGWCSRRLGAAPFIGERRGGVRALPVDTCPRRPATSSVSERGRRRRSSRGDCGRTGTNTGSRGRRRAQCRAHCCVGQTAPVLAVASSGIGECQGRVKVVWTKMVARFGTLWQSGKRARAKQSAQRHS